MNGRTVETGGTCLPLVPGHKEGGTDREPLFRQPVGPGREGLWHSQRRRSRKRWWQRADSQCGQRGARPGPAPGTERLPGSGERVLPPHREGDTDPAQPGTQGSGARQPASGRGRGSGCPGQGVQSLPARRGGTRFPGQQLTGHRRSVAHSAANPSRPRPGPGSLPHPTPSPGLVPSWALGARVTVSGLAGLRPGLCQLARAAAASHYLARPAKEGY